MKISLNWLRKFVDIKVPDDELVRLIGSRLVEVEEVVDETHKYDNIFVVRVEKAEKIPDTHLTLCWINVGEVKIPKVEKNAEGLVQVVCGAPNVHEGMLAAWIAPGAVVPASVNEDAPFVIGKRKMLGKYESNGMLAGADELDFSTEHKTIAEIDPEIAQPGDALAKVLELDDKILDIENKSLTHRPDCFGMIGFAREVAGILGEKFEYKNMREDLEIDNSIEIKIGDKNICQRYTAIVLEKHGELKQKYLTWQDTILAKSGMRSVDPVVDATNYLMLLTGQPLHAFDYDKFVAVGGGNRPEIVVRLARKGEKLILLDDREVELNENDIVIASGEVPVALAGAMGGKSTEIDEDTRNIIIESATFSLYNLRKTQMEHGIFSEAITRFTKGQSPYQTLSVAGECVEMLTAGFKISAVADKYLQPEDTIVVKVTVDEINGLLGTEYSEDLIVRTLENVGFEVSGGEGLEVVAPAWRTDIHIKEDIIEEVGRLLGYDNIVPTLPLHQTAGLSKMWELKKRIREIMRRLGANELLTYSFVAGRLLERVGQDPKNSYRIVNSISPELQYVRQSIAPSLLDKAYMNQKIPFDKFALYEINKVYQKAWGENNEKVPEEKMQMGLVLAERKSTGVAYYKAKKYVEELLEDLNISVKFLPNKSIAAVARPFEPKRSAEIVTEDGEAIGIVGEFKNSVRHNFKLAEYLAGFELDLDKIMAKTNSKKDIYLGEIEKRDLTIKTVGTYAELIEKIEKILAKNKVVADIMPLSIYQPIGKTEKNISVHLNFHQKIDTKIMQELEAL